MFTYLPVAKVAAQVVTGLGVSKIVAGIVKNNVAIVTTAEKVMVNTGSIVLGGMLTEQSSKYIERVINDVVTWHEGRKTENETEK